MADRQRPFITCTIDRARTWTSSAMEEKLFQRPCAGKRDGRLDSSKRDEAEMRSEERR